MHPSYRPRPSAGSDRRAQASGRTLVALLTDASTAGRRRIETCSSRHRLYNPRVELTPFPRPDSNRTGARPVAFCAKIVIGAALFGVASVVAAGPASADA